MNDPHLVVKIAAGILLAQFVAWLVKGCFTRYQRTQSVPALVAGGCLVVTAVYVVGNVIYTI